MRDFEDLKASYLFGEWKLGGWWYYYIWEILLEEPVGLLIVGTASTPFCWERLRNPRQRRDLLLLLVPAVTVFLVVSSQAGFSKYLRYHLPAYPFVFIWIGQVARLVPGQGRIIGWFTRAAFSWMVLSFGLAFPHTLSYFNELAGGSSRGHCLLLDATTDWGQGLYFVKEWIDRHPGARPLTIAVFPLPVLKLLDIDFPPTPSQLPRDHSRPNGWHIVSVNVAHHSSGMWYYLLEHEPIDRIGGAIVVCHFDDSRSGEK